MLAASLALLTALPAGAQVYKCKEGATTVFSATPCATDARQIDVRPASGAGRGTAAAPVAVKPEGAAAAAPAPGSAAAMRRQADQMQAERELRDAQALREKLVRDRENELEAQRQKKHRANNNLAGATWLQSISAEMQVISDNYAEKIRDVDTRIAQYQRALSGR